MSNYAKDFNFVIKSGFDGHTNKIKTIFVMKQILNN